MRIEMNPHDKLCTAISILQAHCLAAEMQVEGEADWGINYMKTGGIEHAIGLLIDIIGPCEALVQPEQKAKGGEN